MGNIYTGSINTNNTYEKLGNSSNIIDNAIAQISEDDYNYGLEKIINKANDKYSKIEESYIRNRYTRGFKC